LVADEGVDIAGDIFESDVQSRLREVKAKCLLVCNIFEHVVDVNAFAEACDKLLLPGGLVIVTVPRSYPYHLAPIDTLFRPAPEAVASMFPGYSVVRAEVVKSTTYADDLRTSDAKAPIMLPIAKDVVKSMLLRGGVNKSLARVHRIGWLFRPYTVSCVAMRKN